MFPSAPLVLQRLGQPLRLACLVVTFGGIIVVLGKTLLQPGTIPTTVPILTLPTQVPIPPWTALTSQAHTPPQSLETVTWHNQHTYTYQQNQASLTITLYYLSGSGTVGDTRTFVKQIVPQALPKLSIHRHPQYGSYALFNTQQQQHLIACLTPDGKSTVSTAEFRENRLQAALQPRALQNWLLGQRPLLDKRCLWTHMMLKDTSPTDKPSKLELAWKTWTQWWQPNFPNR